MTLKIYYGNNFKQHIFLSVYFEKHIGSVMPVIIYISIPMNLADLWCKSGN